MGLHVPPSSTRAAPCALLALLVTASVAATAHATDTWSDPYPGVRLLRRNTADTRAFALEIDLCQAGVSIRATTSSERGRTVGSFGGLVGAQAAVNGDFFGSGYDPSGMAVGEGVQWSDGTDNGSEGSVVFGADRAELVEPSVVISAAPSWMRQVVSGRPQLVRAGAALSGFTDPSHCPIQRARTAVGLSADRRVLYLGVVDETGAATGMTCAQMAVFMRDLGAWDALNLDGGGSSTLWTAAGGTLNSPTDGSPRVVANHIAVRATGSGAAAHCPDARAEVVLQAIVAGVSRTDVDGDGRADACARTSDGFQCALARDDGLSELVDGPSWTDASGWGGEPYYTTIRMGDVNGDGMADVCARGAAGVQCVASTGVGFGTAFDGPVLSDASGWDAEQYFSTIVLADFDGDGMDDLCARAAAGFRCWPSTGAGFGSAVDGPDLGDASGWADRSNYGTIRMGDVDGDGRADVCARANAGMRCWLSEGDGFSTSFAGPEWSDDVGWYHARYYTTITLRDVDGDGRADLCARSAANFRCHLSQGTSFGPAIVGPPLSDAGGWNGYDNYSTIRQPDIDGDGMLDVCARANAGLRCWRFAGDSFSSEQIASDILADAEGWSAERFFRTIRFGDVNGDGLADVCARAAAGLRCWPSTGSSFGEPILGPDWSDALGFTEPATYATVKLGPPECIAVEEQCNGRDDDCDGQVDEDACGNGGAGPSQGGGGAGASEPNGGSAGGGAAEPTGIGVGSSDADGDCGCVSPGRRRSARGYAQWLALAALTASALRRRHRAPRRARGFCNRA